MVLKMGPLFRDLADLGEGKNLIAAAVGQDRPVPIHEPMQPAKVADHLHSWPNEKMVGVSENDLCAEFTQLPRADRLHCALRPDRHEGRRLDHAMRRRQPATAGLGIWIGRKEFKHAGKV